MNTNIRDEYREELRQRARLAACAKYRRGRARRGCSLPSDALTPAQFRRRNGPVRVFRGGVEVTEDPALQPVARGEAGECAVARGEAGECAVVCGEAGECAVACREARECAVACGEAGECAVARGEAGECAVECAGHGEGAVDAAERRTAQTESSVRRRRRAARRRGGREEADT